MSNSIRRNFKKQTIEERIAQIGRVQTEMWITQKMMTKELGKIQDVLGITNETDENKEEEE
jgi:hypothetical protein